MSDTLQADVTPPPTHDERVRRGSRLARLFARPEAGALAGAIVIYIFFFIVAPPFRNASSFSTVLYVSSTYGLMATPIALCCAMKTANWLMAMRFWPSPALIYYSRKNYATALWSRR